MKILTYLIDRVAFDEPFYVDRYPDVVGCGVSPFEHYVTFGKVEGRHPNKHGRYLSKLPKNIIAILKQKLFFLAKAILPKVLGHNNALRLKSYFFNKAI